ncbi:hypothetical protein EDC01DRAFT_780976 [Geopyxis carbonaria]|nr:hypothetical protein EDC01DRAFT_780976 [Geopyxis carbonaria]
MAPLPNHPTGHGLLRARALSFDFKAAPLSSGMKATIAVAALILVAFLIGLGVFVWKYYASSKQPQPAHVGAGSTYSSSINEKGSTLSSASSTAAPTPAATPVPASTPAPPSTPPTIMTTPPPASRKHVPRRSVPQLNLVIDTPPASATSPTPGSGNKGWTTAAKKVHSRNESTQSSASIEVPPTPSRTFV